ncbi:MAG: arginine--tRNA ligase [Desulfobacterales bacterium]|nr:arginine--tRNA ligase [Desulfobacterales bacterium]
MDSRELKEAILTKIENAAEKAFGSRPEGLNLVYPPGFEMGDFACGCFPMAKQYRRSPNDIAQKIVKNVNYSKLLQKVEASGPYINIKVSNAVLFDEICSDIIIKQENFCALNTGDKKRVMVEYLSPNTNKPLHLGHLRNGALGMAITNLFEAAGHHVVKANLINNRGVHICKSMLAWKRWGNGATPESERIKGDHFVGRWYVRYSQEAEKDPHLETEVQEMLQQWEAGDPEIVKLWKMMNEWVYDGFSETYEKFGLKFDAFYYESDTYKLGKDIITQGLENQIFQKVQRDDGAGENVVFHLPVEKFGREKNGDPKKITVLRDDGTSLYMTQDIGTAILKATEHNLDRSIYVVGSEQVHHFQCLFEILKAFGYPWSDGCYHLSYGMVYLPEGKMKSREGKVVDADDLIEEIEKLAAQEISRRNVENPLSEEELNTRKQVIGQGAIKFYLLRVRAMQDIHFDPQESISFDGFTGPYCQYAYARISGILRNAADLGLAAEYGDGALLGNEEELQLIRHLIRFPEELEIAVNDLTPSRLAAHVFNTAKAFNQFYNKHQVIHAGTKELVKARLILIKAAGTALKTGLNLLGIDVLERM